MYTKYFNLEIMFHVAAYLPFEDHNEQQVRWGALSRRGMAPKIKNGKMKLCYRLAGR